MQRGSSKTQAGYDLIPRERELVVYGMYSGGALALNHELSDPSIVITIYIRSQINPPLPLDNNYTI